jgi:hypothetical protein
MSKHSNIQEIKELLIRWKSGELSSYDFAQAVDNMLSIQ